MFCAVDVETSGLRMTSRVVEVGAVRFNMAGERTEFQKLVNPLEPIDGAATDIHGINDNMVRSAPPAREVMPDLLFFMEDCVMVAHNAPFDATMVAGELARTGDEAPSSPVVCTVRLARSRMKGLPSYGLGALVDFLGIEAGTLHNALPDAHAAASVFLEATGGLDPSTPVRELPGFMGEFRSVARAPSGESRPPDGLRELEVIVEAKLTVEMDYGPSSRSGPVVVTPEYLYGRNGHYYMRAYCHRDGISKTYRMDRIVAIRSI